MKSTFSAKLIKFAIVEVLLQLGFEKTAEHPINIITDIFIHYLTQLFKRTLELKDVDTKLVIEKLFSDFYNGEEYEKEEIYTFLDQQLMMQKQIREDSEEDGGSLMNMLQIFPAGIKMRNPVKPVENMITEEKILIKMYEDIDVDPFLEGYVKRCQKEVKQPVFEEMKYDVSELCTLNLENGNRELPRYCPEGRDRRGEDGDPNMVVFSDDFHKSIKYNTV